MPDGAFDPAEQLERARAFVERGWRPFPVEFMGKKPHVLVGKWGTGTASPAPDKMLIRWFGSDQVNIGIAAKGSGLVIIDEDTAGAFLRLAADHGHEVPLTYTVITAKGRHYYFTAPEGYPIGNAPGVLKDYGIDVRGGGEGDGGYVVAAGSTHSSGFVYTVAEDVDAVDMPMWLVELLLPRLDEEKPVPAELVDDETSLFSDRDARRFTRAQAREYMTAYAAEPLQAAQPGSRNTVLNNAATVVGHFVPAFLSHEAALKRLLALAAGVGLGGHEAGATARSGLARGMEEPYVLVEEVDPASPDDFEREVEKELQRLRVRDEAQRRHRLERRAERPSIMSGIIDDLDDIEPPAFLVHDLIPDNAVGFLAGRSGAYKSFLGVAWAFAIATGKPWLDAFPVSDTRKTLYVAAEGSSGAVARVRAWEEHTGISRAGKLLIYPKPIHLNDDDQAAELGEVIRELDIGFLVVDTYHRSAPGTEENDATAFGLVFDAVARFRDELGVGVLFVDHTGKQGTDPRGSSAKGDDADYVLSAHYEGEERKAGVVRTLTVRKLKDQESGRSWPLQLIQPTTDDDLTLSFPIITIPDDVDTELITPNLDDWREKAPPFPEGELEGLMAASSGGRYVRQAQNIWRLLAHLDDGEGNHQGLTEPAIRRMMNDGGDDQTWSEQTIRKSIALLVNAKLAERQKDRLWLVEK